MRACILGLFIFAGLGASSAACAVVYPAATLLGGEVQQSVVGNQCYIARSASEFQRNGAGKTAFVTISEMVAGGYQVNGRINLTFATTTGGTARLPFAAVYPANVQAVPFSQYSQTYTATTKTLDTQFKLEFPGCALRVHALYISP